MDGIGLLKTCLLDLMHALRDSHTPLILGGGLGLYLKQQRIQALNQRTLLVDVPAARSTNDMDIFIRAEILADRRHVKALADAVYGLGYEPIETARYMQFKRVLPGLEGEVKLDFLVGPAGACADRLKIDARRVRPKGERIRLHARRTDEALGLEDQPIKVPLDGQTSAGTAFSGVIFVPQAFPYMLMKLCAFRDRKDDARKDEGRHHALDLFRIVAMMTEEEYQSALAQRDTHCRAEAFLEVQRIVRNDFSSDTALGVLRLREHPLFAPFLDLTGFVSVLKEIFGPRA